MDKEEAVYIYNGILFSHRKELNWVNCSDMEKPRACYTELGKSERKKKIHKDCISTRMYGI